MEKLSESLRFDNKENFIPKIANIINEVKEMFQLKLDILNIEVTVSAGSDPYTPLYYRETEDEDSPHKEFKECKKANEKLKELYRDYPDLKMPGTILHKILENKIFFDHIANQLKYHAEGKTFKHNPLIQKLLNNFVVEFNNLPTDMELESSLVSEQNESPEGIEHFNIHPSDTSRYMQNEQSNSMILGGNTGCETEI